MYYNYRDRLYAGAQPITYKGIAFKSKLEATWAIWCDVNKVEWHYEKETSLDGYLVDFFLPNTSIDYSDKGIYIETKSSGAWNNPTERDLILSKARSLINETNHSFLVILAQPAYYTREEMIEVTKDGYEPIYNYNLFADEDGSTFRKIPSEGTIFNTVRDKLRVFKELYGEIKEIDNSQKYLVELERKYKEEADKHHMFNGVSSEFDQLMQELWKDTLNKMLSLDQFANFLGVEKFTPQVFRKIYNTTSNRYETHSSIAADPKSHNQRYTLEYKENTHQDFYYLWDESIVAMDEYDVFQLTPKVDRLLYNLNRWEELPKRLPENVKIQPIETFRNTRDFVAFLDAVEDGEYVLNLSVK